jgi:hypothetical protein
MMIFHLPFFPNQHDGWVRRRKLHSTDKQHQIIERDSFPVLLKAVTFTAINFPSS